jgi:mannose-6-phosphate isomerase-like protein (cupin superfamily)
MLKDYEVARDYKLLVLPWEGEILSEHGGELVTLKVRGETTGGAWSAVETTKLAKSGGPDLHVHTREDEMMYMVGGALRFQVGDRKFTAYAGSVVFLPRGVPHTFCNPFDESARVFGIISPAGFEYFFEETSQLFKETPPGTPPDLGRLVAVAQKYGGEYVGPPMDVEKEARALREKLEA